MQIARVWLLVFLTSIASYGSAQKKNVKEHAYTSSFYAKPVQEVKQLLFLYRPELFQKKSLPLFITRLKDSCAAHGVNAVFAETAIARADSLKASADFICRISIAKYSVSNRGFLSGNQAEAPRFLQSKTKNFSVIAFTDVQLENPVWKCYCNFDSQSPKKSDLEAADCLFFCLKKDGIVN